MYAMDAFGKRDSWHFLYYFYMKETSFAENVVSCEKRKERFFTCTFQKKSMVNVMFCTGAHGV